MNGRRDGHSLKQILFEERWQAAAIVYLMRILVTGGAGYIGSHFAQTAARRGHIPVTIDNLVTGHARFVKFGPFVQADLRDTKAVLQALGEYRIDAVVHFAARSIVSESIREPDEYMSNNVQGTISLLQAMSEAGVSRLIMSSSCAVYGHAQEAVLRETHPLEPINPYGESKLQCEKLVAAWVKEKEERAAVCLRYFNVVGQDPGGEIWEDHRPETHLVPNLLKALREDREFFIFGNAYPTPDGTCIRDFVDVNDLAAVHSEALERIRPGLLVSNVGTGNGYSVGGVIQLVERLSGSKIRCTIAAPRTGESPILVADGSFFRTWYTHPLKSLEESLRSMIG